MFPTVNAKLETGNKSHYIANMDWTEEISEN